MNYNGVLPANVRYDKSLGDKAKLLYVEITAAFDDKGTCTKTDAYFSKLMGTTTRTVARALSELLKANYITKSLSSSRIRTLSLPTTVIKTVVVTEPVPEAKPEGEELLGETFDTLTKFWESQLNVKFSKSQLKSFFKMFRERQKMFDDLHIIKAVQSRIAYLRDSEYHNRPENREALAEMDIVLKTDTSVNQWIKLHDLHK